MPLLNILILLGLVAIVVSLGSSLFYLVNDNGESRKMVRALTVRATISVLLFILLLVAWWQGMIEPLGFGG